MPENGVILVVTNAGSHHLELEKSIKQKSLKKNVKIYFAFSPFCEVDCGESFPVYKRLSDGRMFNDSDFSTDSFLKTVVFTVWCCFKGSWLIRFSCHCYLKKMKWNVFLVLFEIILGEEPLPPMARMEWMVLVLNFLRERGSNQGSSLYWRCWDMSRKGYRDQRLPFG